MKIDRVELTASDQAAVYAGGRRHIVTAVWDGTRAWAHVDGRVILIEPRESGAARSGAAADHDALSAPMPATVTRIDVAIGSKVKQGDVLVLLEAMKMELPIRAPRDGAIARVNCSQGQLVQPGEPLVDLA